MEERCKFSDYRSVCGVALFIYTAKDSDIKEKFRLSINSGINDLNKGKPVIGHAA